MLVRIFEYLLVSLCVSCVIIAGTFVLSVEVDLGDVIFAIAPDVGPHWKSLIDLLGMEARKDVQKIQHECTKTQEGSSSLAQVMLFPLG